MFADERQCDTFQSSPLLRAALDSAPDPVHGVLVYPHRGGGSGVRQPRRPYPRIAGGAAALPVPHPDAERIVSCTTLTESPSPF